MVIGFVFCGSASEGGKGEWCYSRQFNNLDAGYPPKPEMWVQAMDFNSLAA